METINVFNDVMHLADHTEMLSGKPRFKRVMGNDNGEVLLVALDKEVDVPRHHVPCDVLVQVLEGEIKFTIYGAPEKHFHMRAGDFIRMAPNTEHSLLGIKPAKFTVTKINA